MRAHLLIICTSSIAFAFPQGYNYHQPTFGGINNGGGFGGSSFSSRISNTIGGGSGFINQQRFQQPQQQQGQAIITKHFYIHSAPEETVEEFRQQALNVGQPRKHYNVVFIKAPSLSPKAAALSVAQAQSEEKTIIYVLTKKTDASDIQTAVQEVPTQPSKPEVFFIKYKTLEEAQHAQHQIQAQYDALGGTTQISDEGIAPVSSVVGSLGSSSSMSGTSSITSSPGGGFGGSAYLPPHIH